VRLLAEKTGAHALYAFRKSPTDPNYYANTPYKHALQRVTERYPIHFVLDLHGCSPDRDVGIALGTMHNHNCPAHRPRIIRTFAAHGFDELKSGLLRGWMSIKHFPPTGASISKPSPGLHLTGSAFRLPRSN